MCTSCCELKAFCRISRCTHKQTNTHTPGQQTDTLNNTTHTRKLSFVFFFYLKLLLQFLSQSIQFVQALTQIDMTVKLDEGLDEIWHAPLGFHLITATETQKEGEGFIQRKTESKECLGPRFRRTQRYCLLHKYKTVKYFLDFNWALEGSRIWGHVILCCYLSRALDSAFCRLVEAAGKGNLTAMLRQ